MEPPISAEQCTQGQGPSTCLLRLPLGFHNYAKVRNWEVKERDSEHFKGSQSAHGKAHAFWQNGLLTSLFRVCAKMKVNKPFPMKEVSAEGITAHRDLVIFTTITES